MRDINLSDISKRIGELCLESNFNVRPDILQAVRKALDLETSATGKEVLEQVIRNAEIAAEQKLPICQDTGYVSVFVELGTGVFLHDDLNSANTGYGYQSKLHEAINNGVRQAYNKGSLRKSMVASPIFSRINTGDNTPASIYIDLVDGENIKLTVMPKGGGTENASVVKMLPVSGDADAVKKFVIEATENAAKSCPPVIVGIGIGGSFDKVGYLAKKALLRSLDDRNPDKEIAAMEDELLDLINKTGIGPAGLGGNVTALGVKIETAATHIACLPVAVAFNCIAARQAEVLI